METREDRIKELETGIQKFNLKLARLEKRSRKFGFSRLIIFFSGLSLFLISFFFLTQIFVWISLVITVIVFGIATGIHNKIDEGIKKCKIWIAIKKENLARINIEWQNIPERVLPDIEKDHPFNFDLNITGKNSLHQLLDTSTSVEGSMKLRDWLLTKIPSEETILKRQNLIKELIPLHHFRNRLILNSNLSSVKKLEGTKLNDWLESKSSLKEIKTILIILSFLIPVNIFLFILFLAGMPAYWNIGLLVYLGTYWFNNKHISELFEISLDIETEFGRFSKILEFLEKYNYSKAPTVKEFCKSFFEKEKTPSSYFKKLKRISTAISFQKNPLTMVILNIVFPYDFLFAFKLEKIKTELKELLPKWLETFYNLEALISLSNFAYLNPEYTFPVILKEKKLVAENIVHPFIPYKISIANNFSASGNEVTIITGSNMSGKSTFLKTLGINIVLYFAGSVVCAKRFEAGLFRLYTCINIIDSVTDGISYFYAEVKRLKNLLNELKKENSLPVFYLIDEIFRGTNNLERLIGSRSYIKAISGLNGTGLISTHDLELIKLEDEINSVKNYHFKEDISDGRMIFDYKLREGPSPTTNALKIMEKEGLPVERRE